MMTQGFALIPNVDGVKNVCWSDVCNEEHAVMQVNEDPKVTWRKQSL
jgi:hypothetical protein